MDFLENANVDLDRCLKMWNNANTERGRALCLGIIQDIQTRWEATTEPITNAYWSLRQLCHSDAVPPSPGRDAATSSTSILTRRKRAVVSISVIVLALISAFSAGSAIGFAVQNQLAKEREEQLSIKIDEITADIDAVDWNLRPQVFTNTMNGVATHGLATAALMANTIARKANYYAGSSLTASGTKEKHLAEAISVIRRNRTQPLSKNMDKEDALYRQLCTTQVVSSISRKVMSRSRCRDVNLVESLICILPDNQGSTRYRYRYRYRRYLQLSYHIDSDIILLFFDIFINWMIINMSNHSHSTAITNFQPIGIFGALSDTIF